MVLNDREGVRRDLRPEVQSGNKPRADETVGDPWRPSSDSALGTLSDPGLYEKTFSEVE